jgi:hypothetical protein
MLDSDESRLPSPRCIVVATRRRLVCFTVSSPSLAHTLYEHLFDLAQRNRAQINSCGNKRIDRLCGAASKFVERG